MAERDGSDQGGVLDLDAVEHLEALAQTTQDGHGVLDGGLVHQQRLEPAFEGGVLLDVLAVLLDRGGADQMQLAAGQHRLEHVARVHRALSGPRPDDRVQLVDEQQDPALGRLHLVEDGLEPLLELAPVFGARDQRGQVEIENDPVAQSLGHVAPIDPLREPFDDGGLAHPGVADEDRVVLGLAGQDLHHPPDLGVPADHWIELPGGGVRDEIPAVLLQRLVGDLGHRGRHPLMPADLGQRLQELVSGQPL